MSGILIGLLLMAVSVVTGLISVQIGFHLIDKIKDLHSS